MESARVFFTNAGSPMESFLLNSGKAMYVCTTESERAALYEVHLPGMTALGLDVEIQEGDKCGHEYSHQSIWL